MAAYLLTYSVVQCPSWEANWFEASQEIPRISRNPKVHYRTHKRPPPVSLYAAPCFRLQTLPLPPIPPEIKNKIGGVVSLRIVLSPEQSSRMWMFLNNLFYREGLLATHPTPKLEDHPSSAVRNCLFNVFAATLIIGGRSSIRNLRTRHAVVTGTHYMDILNYYNILYIYIHNITLLLLLWYAVKCGIYVSSTYTLALNDDFRWLLAPCSSKCWPVLPCNLNDHLPLAVRTAKRLWYWK